MNPSIVAEDAPFISLKVLTSFEYAAMRIVRGTMIRGAIIDPFGFDEREDLKRSLKISLRAENTRG